MKKLYLVLVVSILAFNAHAQLKKFVVEVPQKPRFVISDSIQSFTILNRSMTSDFKNYNEDSLQISFYKQNFTTKGVILDSVAADTTIKVLSDLLFESDRFDVVIPEDYNIYRAIPYTDTPEPLSWDYVEAVCRQFNTDALIVLENLAMSTKTKYITQTEIIDYAFERTYFASIDFYSRAHWRIYEPKSKKIIVDMMSNQDTLHWESYEYKLITCFDKLPKIKDAAIETGIKAALDFSDVIAPKWIQVTRYYYVAEDTSIDRSITLAAAGDWEGALENWLAYADKGSSTQKSKVMLNCALAYEMTGDLDKAIEMAKNSLTTYYREVTNFYLKELHVRKAKSLIR